MKFSERIMGMDAVIEILDDTTSTDIEAVFNYLYSIDELFSPFKKSSQISKINLKKISIQDSAHEIRKVLSLCESTKKATNGVFDIKFEDHIDPSGVVTGYAIHEASELLRKRGYRNFYISIGADIEVHGLKNRQKWKLGIFNEITKTTAVIRVTDRGISTSGLSSHGIPIYNPLKKKIVTDFRSVTTVASNCFDSDRFATALFAMGERGIEFVEKLENVEAFFVRKDGSEVVSSGFTNYM